MGVQIAKRPDIPSPKKRVEYIDIPGKDGSLVVTNDEYDDIEIMFEMNFVENEENLGTKFRKVKAWLLTKANKLVLSDDTSVFYKVKNVSMEGMERAARRGGKFIAKFRCDPYTYFSDGEKEYDLNEIYSNPYCVSKPIYLIKGEGICTIKCNGKSVKANVGQNLTINTELMIAFRTDGGLNNTALAGDYKNLYLKNGANTLEITPGFDVKIIPNWRCL